LYLSSAIVSQLADVRAGGTLNTSPSPILKRCKPLFMLSKITIITLLSFLVFTSRSQKFDTLISKIFFNSNLAKADTNLISTFKSNTNLKLLKLNWIAYPPETKPNDTPKPYSFRFQKNPFFNQSFDSGSLR
jgi:hypothetical protein